MKILSQTFKQGGFNFCEIQRVGNVLLLSKTKDKIVSYEVVIVQSHGEYQIAGQTIEAAEHMPPSSSWGKLGWSYTTMADALKRFNKQCEEQAETLADAARK